MTFIEKIRRNAKASLKTIVLPEAFDPRVLKAAVFLRDQQLVVPVLLGKEEETNKMARENSVNLDGIQIIDVEKSPKLGQLAERYYEMRKNKGITPEKAAETVKDGLFFGAFMVRDGEAAGAVAGSMATTADVMRAGIQIIGVAQGIKVVSSSFIMVLQGGREITFADCAVIPNPDAEQLASIAISSAKTHQMLVGEAPKVAMLSFSTKGSAQHEDADKVIKATARVKELMPELSVDGEMQFDAAYVESIGKKKAPGSPVAGNANVYIFPDLDSGNIGYKIAQRIGGAEAVGPVVQGLAKPFNDLSRGCSVDDIINVACICSILSN
jgi:phosphate acetyltransferase